MDGVQFQKIARDSIEPKLILMGFGPADFSISGRMYRARFDRPDLAVSVSFEPGEDQFFVIVFSKEGGILSDPDDQTRTLRLEDLRARYSRQVDVLDRKRLKAEFAHDPSDKEQVLMSRVAQDLILLLPPYLATLGH